VEFRQSERTIELLVKLERFMDEHVYPAESLFDRHWRSDPLSMPREMEDLRAAARDAGLWNLCLPNEQWGSGLTNLEYAPLAEVTGRSPYIASEALNCQAPDSGNMEILGHFGSEELKDRYLRPLLDGEICSCFSMTEPDVPSSDPRALQTTIVRDGDEYVVNGRKWWTGRAADPRCAFAVVVGISRGPELPDRHRQSIVVVPLDTPGVTVQRTLSYFGYGLGACAEVIYDDARVPAANLLAYEGGGFEIAQARLGPGRIHHAMRCVGMAQRGYELMCRRAHERAPFGKPLAEQGVVQDWIAESYLAIEQARLLAQKAAWQLDTYGNERARVALSAIKVAAPRAATFVIDRAIQVYGAAGVSQDLPLAHLYALARSLQIGDGPDEVHKMVIARDALRRPNPTLQPADQSARVRSA
jgi:acyl-CoA dehydrogenase